MNNTMNAVMNNKIDYENITDFDAMNIENKTNEKC